MILGGLSPLIFKCLRRPKPLPVDHVPHTTYNGMATNKPQASHLSREVYRPLANTQPQLSPKTKVSFNSLPINISSDLLPND